MKHIENENCVNPLYFEKQDEKFPRWREILIDWLVKAHDTYEFRPETLYITINILDRYCQQRRVDRKLFHLIGIVCLLIACKLEEVRMECIDTFIHMSTAQYTRQQLLDTERDILKVLKFRLKCFYFLPIFRNWTYQE